VLVNDLEPATQFNASIRRISSHFHACCSASAELQANAASLPEWLLQITGVIPFPPPRLSPLSPTALIEPMRQIYGVSDKVLTMALSSFLLGASKKMVLWIEVGGGMIAIETLVHNFLHRTGILARMSANLSRPFRTAPIRCSITAFLVFPTWHDLLATLAFEQAPPRPP
jgi:hypothetical protein